MRLRPYIALLTLVVLGLIAGCVVAENDSPSISAESTAAPRTDFAVTSPAFGDGAPIPRDYATRIAGGSNLSVPLAWMNPPEGTCSFAIEVVDTHPKAKDNVHWLVVDIPPEATYLPIGASCSQMPGTAYELRNGFGRRGWCGPRQRRKSGVHRYRVCIYALDTPNVEIPAKVTLEDFRNAMKGHTLAAATMTGTFRR